MLITKLSFTSHIPNFLVRPDLNTYHKFVMSLFPEVEGDSARDKLGILFAQELTNPQPHIIIQSNQAPSLDNVMNSNLSKNVNIETRELTEHYEQIISRGTISYKIRANPVKTINRKREPLKGEQQIVDWWIRTASNKGLTLDTDRTSVTKQQAPPITWGRPAKINTATITGIAYVANRELLLESVSKGIGKSKSYGYGLLMLAPC